MKKKVINNNFSSTTFIVKKIHVCHHYHCSISFCVSVSSIYSLLTFLFLLVILKFFKKYIISFNYLRIYFFLILLQILMIFIEIFLTFILFNNPINLLFMIKLFLLSLVLSYPLFVIFSKIDLIK